MNFHTHNHNFFIFFNHIFFKQKNCYFSQIFFQKITIKHALNFVDMNILILCVQDMHTQARIQYRASTHNGVYQIRSEKKKFVDQIKFLPYITCNSFYFQKYLAVQLVRACMYIFEFSDSNSLSRNLLYIILIL